MPSSTAAGTSTTAVRGTIDDNPWATVVDDATQEQDTAVQGNSIRNRNNLNNPPYLAAAMDEDGMMIQLLDIFIQICLCFDATLGVFWVVWGSLLHHRHYHEEDDDHVTLLVVICCLFVGTLLIIRSIAVVTGLFCPPEYACQRQGVVVAGYLSVGLAVICSIIALTGLIAPHTVRHYLTTHPLDLTAHQITWLFVTHYQGSVVLTPALLALLEAVKYPLYKIFHHTLLIWDDQDERLETQALVRREAARGGRPWWWQHHPNVSNVSRHNGRHGGGNNNNTSLTEALLEGEANNDTPTQRRRRRFILWPFGNGNSNYDPNLRNRHGSSDSIDFASVQSEWASRTAEDPVWWSREDADVEHMRTPPRTSAAEVDTSWAYETTTDV
jgi:hypothetical protein